MRANQAVRRTRVILILCIGAVAVAIGLWCAVPHPTASTPGQPGTGAGSSKRNAVDESIGPLVARYRRSVEAQPGRRGHLFEAIAIGIGATSLSATVKESQILGWFGQPDVTSDSGNQKTLEYEYGLAQPNDNAVWFVVSSGTVQGVYFGVVKETPSTRESER